MYLCVQARVRERAQNLVSQRLPFVEWLQNTMIHVSEGKLHPQKHLASLYSDICCRASVLSFH